MNIKLFLLDLLHRFWVIKLISRVFMGICCLRWLPLRQVLEHFVPFKLDAHEATFERVDSLIKLSQVILD